MQLSRTESSDRDKRTDQNGIIIIDNSVAPVASNQRVRRPGYSTVKEGHRRIKVSVIKITLIMIT